MLQIQLSYRLLIITLFYFSTNFCLANSFNISEVEKNIFLHYGIHEDSSIKNQGDIANIGFIVGKKSVLIIDTGGTLEIAKNLLETVKNKTSLPISHVVITHGHPDHYLGSEIFKISNIQFIGHENLKRSINMNFNFYKTLQASSIEDQSILDIKPVFPDLEIKKNQTISVDLGDREVKIRAWESGHTDSDLSVYDVKSKILWTENIFVNRIPSVRASILGWKKNLEITSKMDISKIIPGHGKITTKDEALLPMLSYFRRMIKEIRTLHDMGINIETAQKEVAKDNKENWLLFNDYHISNVTKAYSELEWE